MAQTARSGDPADRLSAGQGAGAKPAPNDPRSHQEWNGGASGMVLG